MVQVRIENITGGVLPISVYIADYYGNNKTFLGTINSTVPPTVTYNNTIPQIFSTAPQIMLILEDATGCETFKLLDCTLGCSFEIIIQEANCICNITISKATCIFGCEVT